jgi:hypothetical protein
MTAQVNVSGRDGGSNPITLRAEQASDFSLAMHHVVEVAGAPAAAGNELSVKLTPVATVGSAALENFHVLKAAAGTLYAVNCNATQTGYVMLFDAAGVPGDGAVTPRKVWFYSAATQQTIDKAFNPPLAMAAGAVLVFSTTGPFTKTTPGSGAAQLSGEMA